MEIRHSFLPREVARTFALYLGVGAAFVPWGAAYAFIDLAGWNHWSIPATLLGAGIVTANFVWRALEARYSTEGPYIVYDPYVSICDAVSALLKKDAEIATPIGDFAYFAFNMGHSRSHGYLIEPALQGASPMNTIWIPSGS